MNFDQAFEQAKKYLRSRIVTMLWGNPGIGKSALGRLLADTYELKFIDMRLSSMDPVDLNGYVHKDEQARTFDYLPWARFPLQDAELPIMFDANGQVILEEVAERDPSGKVGTKVQSKRYKGWLILVDELPNSPRQNLAAAYKLFLDRMIGQEKLHDKCFLMAGGNLAGQGLAGALPPPLISRMAHITMEAEITPALAGILGASLTRFLTNHPKFMYKEPKAPNEPFPTLRTWEMAKHYIDKCGVDLQGLTGIVGTDAAVAYYSFQQQETELLELLKGVEPFPMDRSQDLINLMNAVELERHMHRFQGEWKSIASVDLAKMKNPDSVEE